MTRTPEGAPEPQQLRRAWHFGANAMRNHLRIGRRSPNNPLNQIPWDDLGSLMASDLDVEAQLCARRDLGRLWRALGKGERDYLAMALQAENQAALARSLGVTRAAVTKRLRAVRRRARVLIEEDRNGSP